jgi:hypothetical protein
MKGAYNFMINFHLKMVGGLQIDGNGLGQCPVGDIGIRPC